MNNERQQLKNDNIIKQQELNYLKARNEILEEDIVVLEMQLMLRDDLFYASRLVKLCNIIVNLCVEIGYLICYNITVHDIREKSMWQRICNLINSEYSDLCWFKDSVRDELIWLNCSIICCSF